VGQGVISFRIRGLWAGVDVDPMLMSGRELCEALLERGVLAKDTHGSTIRLAPPLVATEDDIDILLEALRDALDEGQPAR
jgi:ornithine--oxo-acid transaminase